LADRSIRDGWLRVALDKALAEHGGEDLDRLAAAVPKRDRELVRRRVARLTAVSRRSSIVWWLIMHRSAVVLVLMFVSARVHSGSGLRTRTRACLPFWTHTALRRVLGLALALALARAVWIHSLWTRRAALCAPGGGMRFVSICLDSAQFLLRELEANLLFRSVRLSSD
jgi:hypothetical protein